MGLKNFTDADTLYERILLRDTNNPMVYNNFAFSLCQQEKDLERALSLVKYALLADSTMSAYLDTYG
jgi:Tfp pilus assembly protein PilF